MTSIDQSSSGPAASEPSEKPRSCAVCASRKVRCDKQYPCGRCQRAGISCVRPTVDHRPRYVRNLVLPASSDGKALSGRLLHKDVATDEVLDRLRLLEELVKDLREQLGQAPVPINHAASLTVSHHAETSSNHPTQASAVGPQAGRIIRDDSDRVRYVSSGFWAGVDHELEGLEEESRNVGRSQTGKNVMSDQAQAEILPPPTEADRPSLDRHAFLLKHSLNTSSQDRAMLFPLASQIPFLLEVFSERVHFIIGVPHMPWLKKRLHLLRNGRMETMSPGEEALIFSVFYSAICSLDEDEVSASFQVSKAELSLKYRIGLETALAKSDFLNNPSVELIQAFSIFLALARRHDSPKFVWMMTGLVVRMAHYLGLHQDGEGSKHLTPFQVEMQRRTWWGLCALDMRGTEDQGTDPAISYDSHNTRIPLNVNDADLWPEMKEPPQEREELTNVTFLRLCSRITRNIQEMMASSATATVDDHNNWLSDLENEFERSYFRLVKNFQHDTYLAATGWLRIALGRLTLLAFLPKLYSAPTEDLSTEIRTKLLVAAIDVAEHNHALNTDASYQPWRWVYQTQQHWHAVVILLIEICRRPWSATIERAWLALQSPWLVPTRAPIDKNFDVWVPLRKLMTRARRHREAEIARLRSDLDAAAWIETEDIQHLPVPSSSTTFPTYFDPQMYRKRWRELIHQGESTTVNRSYDSGTSDRNDFSMSGVQLHHGGSAEAKGAYHETPVQHGGEPSIVAPLNGHASSSAFIPRDMASSTDLCDYSNLDMFLGTDVDMSFVDFTDDDALGFDWNNLLESARGLF